MSSILFLFLSRNESNLDVLRHAVQESFRRDRANPMETIRVSAQFASLRP
jgi:hypothetical protein